VKTGFLHCHASILMLAKFILQDNRNFHQNDTLHRCQAQSVVTFFHHWISPSLTVHTKYFFSCAFYRIGKPYASILVKANLMETFIKTLLHIVVNHRVLVNFLSPRTSPSFPVHKRRKCFNCALFRIGEPGKIL
jgi:hypothetical protein